MFSKLFRGRRRSSYGQAPGAVARRRPGREQLRLEVLEDRCLLATGLPFLVKDINPDALSSNPGQLVAVNGVTFFAANDGVNGVELWKSDGTEAGTVMVKDITPGSASSGPSNLTNVNGRLFFEANSVFFQGSELWTSDGTPEGTVRLKTRSFGNLTDVNGTLFFTADLGLWKSDGTVGGTVHVTTTGPIYTIPTGLTNVNGTLFFAMDGGQGIELWKSDGTDSGTVLVKDIAGGGTNETYFYRGRRYRYRIPNSSNPAGLKNVNGTLYFTADNGKNGREIWKSDGTSGGTKQVKDINPNGNSNPSGLTNVNGTVYFSASDGTNGVELWKTDGTSRGTALVRDIVPGSSSSVPNNLTNVNGMLFFTADDGTSGRELWKSDGTAAGTLLLKDIQAGSASSGASGLTNVNGTVYFAANDGSTGAELWRSDGTAGGTTLVADINPGNASSSPAGLTVAGGNFFFAADDGVHGRELWDPPVAGNNMTLVGQWDGHDHLYADLWAEEVSSGRFKGSTFAYLGHFDNQGGVDIINITDPSHPVLASVFNGIGGDNELVDVQVTKGIGYFSSNTDGSVYIVDVSNPYKPVQLARIDSSIGGLARTHTLFVDGSYLYQVHPLFPEIRVFDISNPARPSFLLTIASPSGFGIHEVTVRNGRLFGADFHQSGLTTIFDVSKVGDLSVPVPLLGSVISGIGTHTSVSTEDGQFVIVAHEAIGGGVDIYDIGNPAKPKQASNIVIHVQEASQPHQPMVVGNLMYLSVYEAGVLVYDISDPYNPVRVADYDTYTGPYGEEGECAGLEGHSAGPFSDFDPYPVGCGAWGVYPILGNDRILVSDIDHGLFIVSLDKAATTSAATAASLSAASTAAVTAASRVNGGGRATLTDPDGNAFALQFALAGVLHSDGSATGKINFVFGPAFSQVWGALPGVDSIHLQGTVTAMTVADDGTITLEGSLTEKDFARGDGVAFVEENVPFTIVFNPESGQFTLQWCELPTFGLDLTSGSLTVQ